jgi:dGTPase
VDELEGGKGLNLTREVRDGILNHTGPGRPVTLEGQVVRICDRVAYINHDIDDAIRSGILTLNDLPRACLDVLGRTHRERINTMVLDLINNSWDKPVISMSSEVQQATDELRAFLFARVYVGSEAKKEEAKAKNVVQYLYFHFTRHPEALPPEQLKKVDEMGVERVVCDYIAGMTDHFAIAQFSRLFIPRAFPVS